MYQLSDSDSKDSDDGIRFKTESVRNKSKGNKDNSSKSRSRRYSSSPESKYSKNRRRRCSSSDEDRQRSRYKNSKKLSHRESDKRNSNKYDERNKSSSSKSTISISHKETERRSNKNSSQAKLDTKDSLKTRIEDSKNQVESNFGKNKITPELPHHLLKSRNEHENSKSGRQSQITSELPSQSKPTENKSTILGPELPPNLKNKQENNQGQENCRIGEELPPLIKPKSSQINVLENEGKTDQTKDFKPELPLCRGISDNIESKDNIIGPQLPPHLKQKSCETELVSDEDLANDKCPLGPNFPPQLTKGLETNSQIGHELATDIKPENDMPCMETEEHIESVSLSEDIKRLGPELPPHLKSKQIDEPETAGPSSQNIGIGPELPPHLRETLLGQSIEVDEESEDIIGPLPPGESKLNRGQIALEERALQIKLDKLNSNQDEGPQRETWMLELPEAKASKFGLGPRQFRMKAGPDMSDRSSWTDTPQDKLKKTEKEEVEVDIRKEAELKEMRKRDREQESMSKRHKKNSDSLLEKHQKKMKKIKKIEPTERKPFNRETDLQVNRFDEAQKKAILKKAQLLDDRFSSGQSKFL